MYLIKIQWAFFKCTLVVAGMRRQQPKTKQAMWRAAIRLHGLMSHSGDHIGIFGACYSADYVDFLQTMPLEVLDEQEKETKCERRGQDVRQRFFLPPPLSFCLWAVLRTSDYGLPSPDWWQKLNYDSK